LHHLYSYKILTITASFSKTTTPVDNVVFRKNLRAAAGVNKNPEKNFKILHFLSGDYFTEHAFVHVVQNLFVSSKYIQAFDLHFKHLQLD